MGLLEGMNALIFGLANDRSIAWGITQAFHREGANMGISYAGEMLERRVKPLAEKVGCRWLEECDWRTEPRIAKIYHELWAVWLDHIEKDQPFEPFAWWMRQNCKADALYLGKDYPFSVKGIYLSYHGDRGADGARGNLGGFSKIGAKTVTGHSHSPGIEKGAYRVGTSSKLKLEYTSVPSSWLNTHCIISPNGKRQLINVIYGDWRLE